MSVAAVISSAGEDDAPNITTKGDGALNATIKLRDTASRLENANVILDSIVAVLRDKSSSMNRRKSVAGTIRQLLMPLNNNAALWLRNAAKDGGGNSVPL